MYKSILIPTDGTGIIEKSLEELDKISTSEDITVHIV